MKVRDARCKLDSYEVVFAIQKTTEAMTQKLKMALPRGWRLIVEVACGGVEEIPRKELLYLDVQADEGGGSWAEAKIKTLKDHPGWSATHPMEIEELRSAFSHLGFHNRDEAVKINKAKHYTELTPEDIRWLVDVKNGPGIAPGFGGIRIPYRCNFVKHSKMLAESGEVLIGFSGAAPCQDLQFALTVAQTMEDHWYNKKDEFLVMNFEPLKEWSDIEYWMANLGLC